MKNPTHTQGRRAFTLIELLVVIAIIALLASLIFPVTAVVNKQKIRSKARAELEQVAMAIDGYKAKLGYLPPGNGTNYVLTPLYYELAGTTRANNAPFQTLDKSCTVTAAALASAFGVGGLMNSMPEGGSDEGQRAQRFLVGTRPYPTATLNPNDDPTTMPKVLVTSVGWRNESNPIFPSNPKVSPIFYNSFNPTNNPNSYDLWVDVIVGSVTNRISNWSKEAIIP